MRHLFPSLFLLTATTTAAINQITFINKDGFAREVCWFPGAIRAFKDGEIPILFPGVRSGVIPPHGSMTATLPDGRWEGAFRVIFAGRGQTDCPLPSVRGEVVFQDQNGKSWFDVESIDNALSNDGLKWMYAPDNPGLKSGCDHHPCWTEYHCATEAPECGGPVATLGTIIVAEIWKS